MPKQVDVHVRDISTDERGRPTETHGQELVLSYNSFKILNDPESPRFEIIGEVESVDKDGNVTLREGSPNLEAQHRPRPKQQPRSVEPVVSSGPSEKELAQQKEIDELKAKLAATQVPPAADKPAKGKPGPKPKDKALEGATA